MERTLWTPLEEGHTQHMSSFNLWSHEQNLNEPLLWFLFLFALIITGVGRLVLFSRTTSSPLDAHTWLLIVPFAAHALLLQHRTWANARLPHRLKNPERVCYFKCPLTLYGDEEPTLTELLIWQSSGFRKWCAQIFAHIVEFTPASALENVWFHTAEFQAGPLLHLSSLRQQK